MSRNCPQRPRRWGRAGKAPETGQEGPSGPQSPAARATGPVSVGKALEARQGRDGRLCRLARCAARHSRFSRPPAGRIPRSSAPQVSKGGSHRQKRRCEIQRRRRPSSSELAMGPSVHRQRWRWSTVVWTWPASPEMAMLQLDVRATRWPVLPRQKWRCSRKKAASISGGSRGGQGGDHRLQCTRSSFTHALSTRPFSRSSSHASPTCSRHFFGRVESEPHISRNVSSLSGYGSLWVAK